MPCTSFTYDPHYWSIFFGLVGFGAGLAAVFLPRVKPRERGEWERFADLAEMPGPSMLWGGR